MPTVEISLQLTDAVPSILAIAATNSVDANAVLAVDATPNIVIVTIVSATDSCAVLTGDVAQAPVALIPATESVAVVASDVAVVFKSTDGIPLHTAELAS